MHSQMTVAFNFPGGNTSRYTTKSGRKVHKPSPSVQPRSGTIWAENHLARDWTLDLLWAQPSSGEGKGNLNGG